MNSATVTLVKEGRIPKGNVVESARAAALLAVKRVPTLIPMCHPVQVNWVEVKFGFNKATIDIECTVRGIDRTGMEMEALTGTAIACLTVYDMCKNVDSDIRIEYIELAEKTKETVKPELC